MEQKQLRLGVSQDMLDYANSDPEFLGSLWFLAVAPPENAAERDSIWLMRRHYTEHDSQAVLHSQRGIPEMLRTMAEPQGEVCSVTRRLLRRGLELQSSRCVNVFFPAKGRILFEQASYNCTCFIASYVFRIFELISLGRIIYSQLRAIIRCV
jgi:hypothetical protein